MLPHYAFVSPINPSTITSSTSKDTNITEARFAPHQSAEEMNAGAGALVGSTFVSDGAATESIHVLDGVADGNLVDSEGNLQARVMVVGDYFGHPRDSETAMLAQAYIAQVTKTLSQKLLKPDVVEQLNLYRRNNDIENASGYFKILIMESVAEHERMIPLERAGIEASLGVLLVVRNSAVDIDNEHAFFTIGANVGDQIAFKINKTQIETVLPARRDGMGPPSIYPTGQAYSFDSDTVSVHFGACGKDDILCLATDGYWEELACEETPERKKTFTHIKPDAFAQRGITAAEIMTNLNHYVVEQAEMKRAKYANPDYINSVVNAVTRLSEKYPNEKQPSLAFFLNHTKSMANPEEIEKANTILAFLAELNISFDDNTENLIKLVRNKCNQISSTLTESECLAFDDKAYSIISLMLDIASKYPEIPAKLKLGEVLLDPRLATEDERADIDCIRDFMALKGAHIKEFTHADEIIQHARQMRRGDDASVCWTCPGEYWKNAYESRLKAMIVDIANNAVNKQETSRVFAGRRSASVIDEGLKRLETTVSNWINQFTDISDINQIMTAFQNIRQKLKTPEQIKTLFPNDEGRIPPGMVKDLEKCFLNLRTLCEQKLIHITTENSDRRERAAAATISMTSRGSL